MKIIAALVGENTDVLGKVTMSRSPGPLAVKDMISFPIKNKLSSLGWNDLPKNYFPWAGSVGSLKIKICRESARTFLDICIIKFRHDRVSL